MADTAVADHKADLLEVGLAANGKSNDETTLPSEPSQIHTPPASDEASDRHKDDDAMSSSSLSDLDEEMEEDSKFEEAARAGAEAEQFSEVKPDRYEGGIPIFQPTMDQFKDFEKYVQGVDPYGMQSGIVVIDPPEEWKRARKALDDMVKTIKIKNPITQEFHGAQGIYTQRNMEKMRSYNLPQWKAICESTENQPPARRGEKRLNADKLLGRGAPKKKSEALPMPDGSKRRAGRPRVRPVKGEQPEQTEEDSSLLAPPTPISPATQPAVPVKTEESEAEDVGDATPTKGRARKQPAAKTTPKPKGRQPKSASRKDSERGGGKGAETTVAARRLRNAREAADEIDEEAFEGFDYRVHDNDQWTADRCSELEEKYWRSLNFSNPMYAADMPGSLFDEDTKEWNVAKLPNLLDLLGQPIPGVNTAYLYLGMWRATFAWHLEDVDLYSINYIHFGAPKQWYSISQKDAPKFENAMKSIWGSDAKACDQFLRHKTYLVSPSLLKSKYGVTVNKVVHREGQFVITFPIGYHSGYNLGYNCAESVNFAIPNWLQYGKTAKKCQCEADSVFIDVDWFIRRMNGEPTPEFEEIEVTDDEDDDEVVDLPTPPGSDRGKVKMQKKRKRADKDVGPNKKRKKLIKIRKVLKVQPCCLCPNDFAWDVLLPTTHGLRAHRRCALYTPETYIARHDDQETVCNVENISKDRLELNCNECRQRKGSCFQCSSAKCTRAYHATCAAQAGVQVDIGEIAVWHEGVEYRDMGFDWRCRIHRTVKRGRPSSELASSNHVAQAGASKEFKEYLSNLRIGDLIQWQMSYVDDIEAGVVVDDYDPSHGSVTVKLLPEQKMIREVDVAFILFVDSSTSCLQKPSANALELPEELQGQAASMTDSSERKPSPGDVFTEDPRTEWIEFQSNVPPLNKAQKAVDLSKDKQLWIYLGKLSTESKAQYTADPSKPIHDPKSNYLDTVEPPPRPIMAPPTQPRRQSLAATYPMNPVAKVNVAARNAAMADMRQQMLAGQFRQAPGPPILPQTPASQQAQWDAARDRLMQMQQNQQLAKLNKHPVISIRPDDRTEQQRILDRQQQKAEQLDMQDRPYSTPASNMSIDQQAVERQRQFQQQAAMQSRNMGDWSAGRTLPPLRQYQPPLPDYSTIDAAGKFVSQQFKEGDVGKSATTYPANGGPPSLSAQPTWDPWRSQTSTGVKQAGSPMLSVRKSPSPTSANGPPGFAYPTPPNHFPGAGHPVQPFTAPDPVGSYADRIRLQNETSRIEGIRAAANQKVLTDPHHQRRISNPAYPFKSPEKLKAQKEAEQNLPQVQLSYNSNSLPPESMKQDSPYASPFLTSESFHPPMSEPPAFIDPNVTQITPPSTSAGFAPPMSMAPPASTVHKVSMPTVTQLTSTLPISAPLSFLGDSSGSASSGLPLGGVLREKLAGGLQPRQLLAGGGGVSDQPVPEGWLEWQRLGGFWGEVAKYFINKHSRQSSVYRSPYAREGEITPYGRLLAEGANETRRGSGLADTYYNGLDEGEKQKIDVFKEHAGMK